MKESNPAEYEEAKDYCYNRILERPNISYKKIIVQFSLCVIIKFIVSFIVCVFCAGFDLYLINIKNFFLFYFILTLIFSILFLRKFFILSIKLYQKYAPENIRRKCCCKPSCSEYSIMVIGHYGVIIGSAMAFKRMFITCSGKSFYIDYPKFYKRK